MIRELGHCRLPVNASLLDALRSLEESRTQIVLMTDPDGRLVGTITDGDIRRALLKGATLVEPVAPHVRRSFRSIGAGASRADVLDLMQAYRVQQLPVVDDDGRLLGLHLLHEVLGAVERPNAAVIMAGGKGTRLRPITESIPKPMIKVAGRPILERLVLHLVSFGFRRIYLSINYMGEVVERHFGDGARFGCQIEYLRETKPLGTGGSLRLLPSIPEHSLVVMNGDLVTQVDLGSMVTEHDRTAAAITLGVRPYSHVVPFGCVELDGSRVTRIEEKPRLMHIVNAGIYIIDPQLIEMIPPDTDYPLPSLVETCLAANRPVHAFEIDDDWIDVGQRDQLRQARGETE